MGDMMDVGWGELLLLGVVALLIFGPDKLPKAAADAGRMVRKLREMASTAQQELTPDLDVDGIKSDLRSVADLHPKRILSSAVADVAKPAQSATRPPRSADAKTSAASGSSNVGGTGAVTPPSQTRPAGSARLDPDAT